MAVSSQARRSIWQSVCTKRLAFITTIPDGTSRARESRLASTRESGKASMPVTGSSSRLSLLPNTRARWLSPTSTMLGRFALGDEGKVKIAKFDDPILNIVHRLSNDVVAEIGSRDE